MDSSELVCLLNLESRNLYHFSVEDEELAQVFAYHILSAIKRTNDELVSRRQNLSLELHQDGVSLATFTACLGDSGTCGTMLEKIQSTLRRLAMSESLVLTLHEVDRQGRKLTWSSSDSLATPIELTGTPLATVCLFDRPSFFSSRVIERNRSTATLFASPGSRCLGLLTFPGSKQDRAGLLQIEARNSRSETVEDRSEEAACLLGLWLMLTALQPSSARQEISPGPYGVDANAEIAGGLVRPMLSPDHSQQTTWVTRMVEDSMRADYARRVLEQVTSILEIGQGSLEQCLPSLAFRECLPLRKPVDDREAAEGAGSYAGPLVPLKPSDIVTTIPRKTEGPLADWLLNCFTDFSDLKQAVPPRIIVVGDSGSDISLARNLATRGRERAAVSLAIANNRLPQNVQELRPFETAAILSDWRSLEQWVNPLLNPSRDQGHQGPKYVVVDIDRTLIMPRGMRDCDSDLEQARVHALGLFVRQVLGSLDESRLIHAYQTAGGFPPYRYSESQDEDLRALATLLAYLEVLGPDDWADSDPSAQRSVGAWLGVAIDRGQRQRLPTETINVLRAIRMRTVGRVPTLLEEYRECEEQAFLALVERERFVLNGHVLKLLELASRNGWIPVGYSDRPGSSVGLRADSHHFVAWPKVPRALVSSVVPVAFE